MKGSLLAVLAETYAQFHFWGRNTFSLKLGLAPSLVARTRRNATRRSRVGSARRSAENANPRLARSREQGEFTEIGCARKLMLP